MRAAVAGCGELPDIARVLAERMADEPLHLQAIQAGVAAGIVENTKDLNEDTQLKERECFWTGEHPKLGRFSYLGQPSRLSKTPAMLYRNAPCLGEHTEYVCRELLGMSQDEFDACLMEGAFI